MLQKPYHTKTSDLISQFIAQNQEKGFTAGELSEFLKANDVTRGGKCILNLVIKEGCKYLLKHQLCIEIVSVVFWRPRIVAPPILFGKRGENDEGI